jgi:hypothetical protein
MSKGFKCPKCERTSYNVNDVINNYCGACHIFWERCFECGLWFESEMELIFHKEREHKL